MAPASAQRNLSALTRAMMEEKQRIIQAELQERLLKEEWPDREELAAARCADGRRHKKHPASDLTLPAQRGSE